MIEFKPFPSIARLSREMIVTEKIDGTNAQIVIRPRRSDEYFGPSDEKLVFLDSVHYYVRAGSRSRWITPDQDNFGFARWVWEHAQELAEGLGEGQHFGEWWGSGIQRGYGLQEKRFSLFNVSRWKDRSVEILQDKEHWVPECCHVVPTLWSGLFDTTIVRHVLDELAEHGSYASPGFNRPEGVVVYHLASGQLFKKTLDKNDGHKGG